MDRFICRSIPGQMKVMITGATGFIGYHLTARLLVEGHAVRALVRSAEKG